MGTGSLERSSGAAELPFSALRAVENDLGRLVAMLVAAEVRLPALLVSREPDGLCTQRTRGTERRSRRS